MMEEEEADMPEEKRDESELEAVTGAGKCGCAIAGSGKDGECRCVCCAGGTGRNRETKEECCFCPVAGVGTD